MDQLKLKRSSSFNDDDMYVVNRAGEKEPLDLEQILKRLNILISKPPAIKGIKPNVLVLQIADELKPGISTTQIDEFIAQVADNKKIVEPRYAELASRLVVDNHHKNTINSFKDKMERAYRRVINNRNVPLISKDFWEYVKEHHERIHEIIDYRRDFLYDYFGFKTFQRNYSLKIDKTDTKGFDRPQDMFMRVAISIHMSRDGDVAEQFRNIEKTYEYLSNMYYTHATPTLSNSGTPLDQKASCFLLATTDSLEGIKDTSKEMCTISKLGGGIGLHINCIRGRGSLIRGTNGMSDGIINFLRGFDIDMQAFNQGGKRPGSAAIYLMPHHPDIEIFLKLRLPTGQETERARHLFYAVWIPDLFMERFKSGQPWSLFDPDETKDLSNYFDGKDDLSYTNEYLKLEQQKKYVKQVNPRDIWELIFESNKLTGMPYLCFSDTANRYNMQNNLGVIKSSNLCTEIYEYSDSNETAVCNLASICLPKFVEDSYNDDELKLKATIEQKLKDKGPEEISDKAYEADGLRPLNHSFPENPVFNYRKLIEVVSVVVTNLNEVIDKTLYPNEKTRRSNLRHRPMAIGVQGLADVYCKMRYAYDSPEASAINKIISETMYYAALAQSTKICREKYLNLKKELRYKAHINKLVDNDTTKYTNFERVEDIARDIKTSKPYVEVEQHNQSDYKVDVVKFVNPDDIPKDIFAYPSMKWPGANGKPSHIAQGIFHWELYDAKISMIGDVPRYDWESLRAHIKTFGVRNSLLIGLMPTATTSQLLGNNECTEPYTSNLYKRKTLAGEFIIINKWLMNDLYRLNIWNKNLKEYLETCDGSIQHVDGIPDEIKALYKTSREIDTEVLIQQAADRQPFVDQGQSLNWYMSNVRLDIFTRLVFKAWRLKLKTAKYYLHSKPAINAQKFTVDPKIQEMIMEKVKKDLEKRTPAKEETICASCSS